jgi:hypothetical protein
MWLTGNVSPIVLGEEVMVNVLIRHTVTDFPRWKQVFDGHLNMRKAGGELGFRMFHNHANPVDLILICEWETLDKAKAFFASETLRKGMAEAGVASAPEVIYLDEIRAFHRTAAD